MYMTLIKIGNFAKQNAVHIILIDRVLLIEIKILAKNEDDVILRFAIEKLYVQAVWYFLFLKINKNVQWILRMKLMDTNHGYLYLLKKFTDDKAKLSRGKLVQWESVCFGIQGSKFDLRIAKIFNKL